MQGRGAKAFVFDEQQLAKLRLANPHRIRQHGLKHRLKFARRRTDDAQHVCRRGLLLQQIAAQFTEQPRVLDGDDGLRGEVLHQFDLLVGERLHLLPKDADDADQFVVLDHRHAQKRAGAAEFGDRHVRLFRHHIARMHDLPGFEHAVETDVTRQSEGPESGR